MPLRSTEWLLQLMMQAQEGISVTNLEFDDKKPKVPLDERTLEDWMNFIMNKIGRGKAEAKTSEIGPGETR